MSAILMTEMVQEALHFLDSDKYKAIAQHGFPNSVEEFRTVAIRCPRQFGHSTASGSLMAQYPNSVLIIPKVAMKDQYRALLSEQTLHERVFAGTFSGLQQSFMRLKGMGRLDLAIFDPAHSFAATNSDPYPIHRIKQELLTTVDVKLFVELG